MKHVRKLTVVCLALAWSLLQADAAMAQRMPELPVPMRPTIVNVKCVREMEAHINGEYFLTLTGGHTVKLSRSYKDKLRHFS